MKLDATVKDDYLKNVIRKALSKMVSEESIIYDEGRYSLSNSMPIVNQIPPKINIEKTIKDNNLMNPSYMNNLNVLKCI